MGETRERIVNFLRDEQKRLLAEVEEVALLLEVLVEPGIATGAEDHGAEAEEPPVVETPVARPPLATNDVLPWKSSDRTPAAIAARNRATVVKALGNGLATTQAIAAATGMTRHTAQVHLKGLHDEGRATRRLGPPDGGRQPYVYSLVPVVQPREHHLDLKTRVVTD